MNTLNANFPIAIIFFYFAMQEND